VSLSFSVWPVGSVDRMVSIAESLAKGSGQLGQQEVVQLRLIARQLELPGSDDDEVAAFVATVVADTKLEPWRSRPAPAPPERAGTAAAEPDGDRRTPLLGRLARDLEQVRSRAARDAAAAAGSRVRRNAPGGPRPAAAAPRGMPAAPPSTGHATVVVLGHIDHGKTTLTEAIAEVLPGASGRPEGAEVGAGGAPFAVRRVEYRSGGRHCVLEDLRRHADHVLRLVTGRTRPDGALLVVSAVDGPMPHTRQQVALARQLGLPVAAVALTMVDRLAGDEEIADLVELEIRDLLTELGYPGDAVPVVRVSGRRAREGDAAWRDRIRELLAVLDAAVPGRPRPADRPFRMPVDQVFRITGRGMVTTGVVESGQVRVGQEVELVGLQPRPIRVPVAGVEMFRQFRDDASVGQDVGLLLQGVPAEDAHRGQVVAAPGTLAAHTRFHAVVQVVSAREPLYGHWRYEVLAGTAQVAGSVTLAADSTNVQPGVTSEVTVDLTRPVGLEEGLTFEVRHEGAPVAAGRVTRLLR
jgi:elongation factor Tu